LESQELQEQFSFHFFFKGGGVGDWLSIAEPLALTSGITGFSNSLTSATPSRRPHLTNRACTRSLGSVINKCNSIILVYSPVFSSKDARKHASCHESFLSVVARKSSQVDSVHTAKPNDCNNDRCLFCQVVKPVYDDYAAGERTNENHKPDAFGPRRTSPRSSAA